MALGFMMLTNVTSTMFKNLGMSNGEAAGYSSMFILAYTIKPFMHRSSRCIALKVLCLMCASLDRLGLRRCRSGDVFAELHVGLATFVLGLVVYWCDAGYR